MSVPVVALIGRPNVGKSALFNRIIGEDEAIVSEEAGTTRDRHFSKAEWNGRAFWLVDTGGLSDDPNLPMDREIRSQVAVAVEEADMILFVVDSQQGLHPSDQRIAEMIRTTNKPWMLVANKVDDPQKTDFYDFYRLGAGDPIPVSAQNGKNSGDLLDELVNKLPESIPEDETALRIAVVGRPNVGKSSFVNRLLGEERLVVSEISGTTRDAIDTPMVYHGRKLIFVDTAGLRRQSKIDDGIEFYSSLRSRRAIERANLCILLIDATEGEFHNQDLSIANMAWEAGRGLIVVVNKWDLVDKDDKATHKFEKKAHEKAPFLKHVPFLFTSALTGQRVSRILDLIQLVDEQSQVRISTSQVNERLAELLARRQPSQAAGREVKLNYATQVSIAPPTIAFFGNHPDLVEEHYIRFLHNGFRETYPFTGNPLRIVMRRKSGTDRAERAAGG
ncbi:MAG: GTP-binding protein engA [Gemmatimonadetes bacterium]|jgi:GTP-binding protein|nr:GTP-binding protein engA [Gemmatimonadota bacterium]